MQNQFGEATISQYAYRNDALARRTDVVYTGLAFSGNHLDLWQHNDRHELIESDRFAGTDPNNPGAPDSALDRSYCYDPIGNRQWSQKNPSDPNCTYTTNQLNQYTQARIPDGPRAVPGL